MRRQVLAGINLDFRGNDFQWELDQVSGEGLVDADDIWSSPFRFHACSAQWRNIRHLVEVIFQPFGKRLIELGFTDFNSGQGDLFDIADDDRFVASSVYRLE